MNYTNPRLQEATDDYKLHFETRERGVCLIELRKNKRGGWNNPKRHPYGGLGVIADGSDRRSYILQHFPELGIIDVRGCNRDIQGEGTVYLDTNKERFNDLMSIIKEANKEGEGSEVSRSG